MSSRTRYYKRNRDRKGSHSNQSRNESKNPVDEDSPVIMAFRKFQSELDGKHDRYERLVKLSRDVTIESKRVIFGLHRVNSENKQEVLDEAAKKIRDIHKHFYKIAVELSGLDPYQFARAYSPGLQEYIEAVSYHHYLKEEKLVTLKEVEEELVFSKHEESSTIQPESGPCTQTNDDISDNSTPVTESSPSGTDTATEGCVNNPGTVSGSSVEPVDSGSGGCMEHPETASSSKISVLVPPMDYVLGIADLTGELMRLAINSIGAGDLDSPFKLCSFMREIHDAFVLLGNQSREIPRKLSVLKQSLFKVEAACYTVQVRGSEVPKHMLADAIVATPVSVDYQDEECCVNEN